MESDLDSSFRKTDDDDCSSSEYDEKPGRSEFVRKAKFKCTHPGCKEEFRREVALDKHVFKHTGIKKHACTFPDCTKSYTNATHLKRHVKTSHELNAPSRFKCEDPNCKSLFATLTGMQKHFKLYHGPNGSKIHGCSECTERFTKKAQLRVHMYIHTGDYPQKCKECDAAFLNLKQLRQHTSASHKKTGKTCPRCKMEFPNWSAFVAHQREVHKKNYSCPHCPNKVYAEKVQLRRHLQATHKETRVFACPFAECEYKHDSACKVRLHVHNVHRGTKVKCTLCDVKLSSEAVLKKHLARMHPDGKPGKRVQKHRIDAGKPKLAAATQLSGIKADPEVEKILLAGEGRKLQIQYTPTACAWDNTSATDTESEASSIVHNGYAF